MPRTLVRTVQTLFDPVYRRIAIGVLLGGLVYMSVLFCALTHRLLGSGGSTRGIAREINTDTDSPDVLITLVHGTIFFRRSNWTQDNSEFRAALARGLQARVQFKDFRWSGRNSFYARRKAAVQLKQDLRRNLKSYPEARHFVIGHSHGGSVSALALADEKLANRTQGLICLATPFLHINQGDALLVFGRYVSALFVTILLVSFPLFWLFGVSRLSLSERSLEGFAIGFLSGLLCLGTVFVFRRSALRAHRSVRAAAAAPALQLNRLLILRHTGDEASAILASGYIWTWATTNLVKRLYFVASVVKQPPWVRLVRPLWGTILFLLPTMWTLDAFHRPVSLQLSIGLGLTILGTAFMWYGFALFGFVLLAVSIIFVVLGPWFLAVTLPAAALIGPELIFTIGHVNVSVETTPPGHWNVKILNFKKSGENALKHSLLYADPEALAEIAAWIREKCET
jgi:pimeloyl-ACP methyl ester carboxylesterase